MKIQDCLGNVMVIVDTWSECHIMCYEAKYLHKDGSLSDGSVFIFGSQMEDYKIINE